MGRIAATTLRMWSSSSRPSSSAPRVDLVPVDAGGEGRLLQLLLHRLRLERLDPVRAHEPARVHEAGQLVAGKKGLLELRVPRELEVLRMGEDRLDNLLGPSLVAKDRRSILGVLVERRMDLVVEVVQKRHRPPELLVLAVLASVEADACLDGERMAAERFALRVPGQRLPGAVTGHVHRGVRIASWVASAACPKETRAPDLVADTLMESFVIEGGRPLSGSIRATGNKNAALPIIAAALLTEEPVTLTNVPAIRDVETMLELVQDLGVEVEHRGDGVVRIVAEDVRKTELDAELCTRIRASILLAGPLVARWGEAVVPPPGGDVIGRRRLDTHIHALARLGAEINADRKLHINAKRLVGTRSSSTRRR